MNYLREARDEIVGALHYIDRALEHDQGEADLAAVIERLGRRERYAIRALERFAGKPSGVPSWAAYLDECERSMP
jgi:hypothetical protein